MSPEPKSVVRIRIVHKINNNHISLSCLPGFMSADVLSRVQVFPQLLACSVTFSPRLFPTIMVDETPDETFPQILWIYLMGP